MSPQKTASSPLRMLIIGTGGMAVAHARAWQSHAGVNLVAGVDTNAERLTTFCDLHNIKHRFASVDEAIDWGGFDAASNVTPDRIHHATSMALIAAGRHVLCEKPLADNYADAAQMAMAATEAGIVNMVNLSYRDVAALQEAHRLIMSGAIGQVRHFEASYLQSWLTQEAWGNWKTEEKWLWRLSTAHGSLGVLGDVGIHILDFATYAAGSDVEEVSCRLKTFSKVSDNKIGQYTLDANDSFTMHVGLSNGATGVIHASRFATGHLNDLRLRVYGDLGGLEVALEAGEQRLRGCLEPAQVSALWKNLPLTQVSNMYTRFVAAIQDRASMQPDFKRGADLQRVLDAAVESNSRHCVSLPIDRIHDSWPVSG